VSVSWLFAAFAHAQDGKLLLVPADAYIYQIKPCNKMHFASAFVRRDLKHRSECLIMSQWQVFLVDLRANKRMIKEAVYSLYEIQCKKINTLIR